MRRSTSITVRLFALFASLAAVLSHASALEVFGVQVPGTATATETLIAQGQVAYTVEVEVDGGDDDLRAAVSGASILVAQQRLGAPDMPSLVARANADHERLIAALYGEARYAGNVEIMIAGRPIDSTRFKAIEVSSSSSPGNAVVPVSIRITPGAAFTFANVRLSTVGGETLAHPAVVTAEDLALTSGAPAKSGVIISATEKLVDAWRRAGYPHARIESKDIAADHASNTLDVEVVVAPGKPAVYGWINVSGARDLKTKTIVAQSKLRSGESFDPADLKTTRERLNKLESVESVRIVEGEDVDANGGIPITLEVTERKSRYIGATASVSSIDGGEVQAYWGHRNLFGGAERLRLDAAISQIGSEDIEQLQFDAGATFTKPGILDVDTDLFSEFRLKRENPDTYESLNATARIGLSRRFSPRLSGTIAIKGSFEEVDDAFGTNRYTSVSLPGDLTYDSRDNRLDATRGVLAGVLISPTAAIRGGESFVTAQAKAATYHALDADGNVVLAGRVFAGSAIGASLSDVPASSRYFGGGGGSVRGFQHRSLGPIIAGEVVGGLSIVEASAEVRIRVTDQFGIVPFVDIASVSEKSFPRFSDTPFIGVGLGFRYYTALGPLRLDLAVPVTERQNQPAFGFYIGLGQAF